MEELRVWVSGRTGVCDPACPLAAGWVMVAGMQGEKNAGRAQGKDA